MNPKTLVAYLQIFRVLTQVDYGKSSHFKFSVISPSTKKNLTTWQYCNHPKGNKIIYLYLALAWKQG
jgi:hypothetical protein